MEPSDEELLQAARDADLLMPDGSTGYLESADLSELVLAFARAVLAHWGNYPAQPGSSPAPPARDEVVEPVAEGPTDEELLGLMPQQLRDDLARPAPAPAPPAAGEVAGEPAVPDGREPTRDELWELWLRLNNELPDRPAAVAEFWEHAQIDARARWGRQPAPPAEGEVAELARWLWMQGEAQKPGPNSLLSDRTKKEHHAAGVKLTRAAVLLAQRHPPAPVPEEVANPWKDALIDALACNFLLTTENESDPKKALHDLISWELELARDLSISLLMRPVPVSERLPGPAGEVQP